jgi:hypothetical protein
MRQRLPIVLSLTALVVAVLGSTPVGEAALSALPRSSVGAEQIKTGAVTSIKVKNGSLLVRDFMPGQIPQGPAGPAGAAGPAGPQGPAGVTAYQTVFTTGTIDSTTPKTLTAVCPSGKRALGGGIAITPATVTGVALTSSYLPNATTWSGSAREIVATGTDWGLNAVVICATVAG